VTRAACGVGSITPPHAVGVLATFVLPLGFLRFLSPCRAAYIQRQPDSSISTHIQTRVIAVVKQQSGRTVVAEACLPSSYPAGSYASDSAPVLVGHARPSWVCLRRRVVGSWLFGSQPAADRLCPRHFDMEGGTLASGNHAHAVLRRRQPERYHCTRISEQTHASLVTHTSLCVVATTPLPAPAADACIGPPMMMGTSRPLEDFG
jgi:hypothetical protein